MTSDGTQLVTWWDAVVAWLAWLWDAPVLGVLVRILITLVVAWLLRRILLALIRRAVDRIVTGVKAKYEVTETRQLTAQSPVTAVRRVKRTQSLGRVFSHGVTTAISIVAILIIVGLLFPAASSAFAIVTAAVGAGLGIGAQGIVRDLLGGIFLAVEDQLGIGDVVTIGPTTGVVEDVSIRITQVRDVEGTLWFIRNGDIDRVGNRSHGWARAIVDFAVPYSADLEVARGAVAGAATALGADGKWRSLLLEKPEVWGLESVAIDHVILRVVVRTRTSVKDDVARELRARIKRALDEAGVAVPPLAIVQPAIDDGKSPRLAARRDASGLVDEDRSSDSPKTP